MTQHFSYSIVLLLFSLLSSTTVIGQESYQLPDNPVELGQVHWSRDYDDAIERSSESGKPILILFQEVPGCSNCTRYGRHVLSHPLIVEAIEDHFVPLAIFNNKGGKDREILQQFDEPSWNNPVVRIVNASGVDLVNRLASDFSQKGLVVRIRQALSLTGETIPEYLNLFLKELDGESVRKEAYLAMYCFWTGEKEIARIPGILSNPSRVYAWSGSGQGWIQRVKN